MDSDGQDGTKKRGSEEGRIRFWDQPDLNQSLFFWGKGMTRLDIV